MRFEDKAHRSFISVSPSADQSLGIVGVEGTQRDAQKWKKQPWESDRPGFTSQLCHFPSLSLLPCEMGSVITGETGGAAMGVRGFTRSLALPGIEDTHCSPFLRRRC